MKKKLTVMCLVVSLIALMVTGATVAYFKDTDNATNVFTMGNIDILLHEDNGLADTDADYKLDDAYESWVTGLDFLPTVTVEKDAWIENVGTEQAYVRMFIIYPEAIAPMLNIAYDADLDANWTDAKDAGNTVTGIVYDIDGVNYVARCLVYNDVLEAGEITTDAITAVTLKNEVECKTLDNGSIEYSLGTAVYTDAEGDFPVFIAAQAGQVTNQLDAADPDYWDNANDALNVMFGLPTVNPLDA